MTRLFAGTQWDRPPRCERCSELVEQCKCPPPPPEYLPPSRQTARLSIEKRKAGKKVTVIRGLAANESNLTELLSKLKNHCGTGGTLRDDVLELQGEQIGKVKDFLTSLEYKVKA